MKSCENCKHKTCINEWEAVNKREEKATRKWMKLVDPEEAGDRCECGNRNSAFFGNIVSTCFLCTGYKSDKETEK